ncbi:MAG: LysM peptidoglycan-binding domain-containing protein [Nitrospirae bacterium]|nr:MAG: LysM peptidoglycan-binding domain-containing protein [Nitrospirota bacterium]
MTISKQVSLSTVILGTFLLMGCVMTEKYEAEKARGLNFQRLLAQEEKRTGELDNELKRVKRESSEMEARNRELTAQVQAVREQMARVQEEADAMREATALEKKAREDLGRAPHPASKPKRAEKNFLAQETDQLAGKPESVAVDGHTPIYHQVKPGETVFRLARKYGVQVEQVRKWNNLQDDLIEVGQKLIVGYE